MSTFEKYAKVDFSTFYDDESQMSLVGALCKARVPKQVAIRTLELGRVIERTAKQGKDGGDTSSFVCHSPQLINAKEYGKHHPFYFLFGSNELDLMEFLIELGGDVNAVDQYVYRALTQTRTPSSFIISTFT